VLILLVCNSYATWYVWVPLCGAVEATNAVDEQQNRARGPSSSYASRLSVVSRANVSLRGGSESRSVGAQSTQGNAVEMVNQRLHGDDDAHSAAPSTVETIAECSDAVPELKSALSTDSVALFAVEAEVQVVEVDATVDLRMSRDPMKQFLSERGSAVLNAPGAQARARLLESISAMQQQQQTSDASASSSASSSAPQVV
jgi:hypothetical protein